MWLDEEFYFLELPPNIEKLIARDWSILKVKDRGPHELQFLVFNETVLQN